MRLVLIFKRALTLRAHVYSTKPFGKSFDIVVGRHKYIYVRETHPTAQQPEPNFITNHFNCVCSRRH